MPTKNGWPASVETEEDYWSVFQTFDGFQKEYPALYVSDLLSDQALDVPHEKMFIDNFDGNGGSRAISRQVITDIRRCDSIIINGVSIYEGTNRAAPFEIVIKDFVDEQKARATFLRGVEALKNKFHLAFNVFKFTTQATLAHISAIIMTRFYHMDLKIGVRCIEQKIIIDTNSRGITTISFNTIWELFEAENGKSLNKFMKAVVEMRIATDDLAIGYVGDAVAFERCSKFYDTQELALKCLLDNGFGISVAKSALEFEAKIQQFQGKETSLSLLEAKSLTYGLEPEYTTISNSSIDSNKIKYFDHFSKLATMEIGEVCVYGEMDRDDPRHYSSVKEDLLFQQCKERCQWDRKTTATYLLLCSRCLEDMSAIATSQFTSIDTGHSMTNLDFDIHIRERKGTKVVEISITTMWKLSDQRSLGKTFTKFLKFTAKLQAKKSDPTSSLLAVNGLKHLFSKFYDKESEARRCNLLNPVKLIKV